MNKKVVIIIAIALILVIILECVIIADRPKTGEVTATEERLTNFIDQEGNIHEEYLHIYKDGTCGFTGFDENGRPMSVIAPKGSYKIKVTLDNYIQPKLDLYAVEMVHRITGSHAGDAVLFVFTIGEGGNTIEIENGAPMDAFDY